MRRVAPAPAVAAEDPVEVRQLLLRLGVALTMTGDAVGEIQEQLRGIAAAYGYPRARIAVFPTLLIIALGAGESAGFRTIDSARQLRLDQASAAIRLARAAQAGQIAPAAALTELDRILALPPRFTTAAYIGSHGILTVGLGLVIHPAAVDLWVYLGVGVYVHNSAPRGSLPWLLVVLFTAWAGQLAGKLIVDATLSGFIGAAVMVPVAHLVGRMDTAPPAHVMFLPAFWLLVPGTIGLIGITEIVGNNSEAGTQNLGTALVSIPAVALGILVGTMVVRAVSILGSRARRLTSPSAGEAAERRYAPPSAALQSSAMP